MAKWRRGGRRVKLFAWDWAPAGDDGAPGGGAVGAGAGCGVAPADGESVAPCAPVVLEGIAGTPGASTGAATGDK
jgi:hypothetical protein